MAGCAAPRWYPDAPENHLPLRLQRHVSDQLRCSKQSRLLRRALPILPPTALTATAHLQPLAQPTALRHPGFRCDIDSHPDCRPFLILIVAPQTTYCHPYPPMRWGLSPRVRGNRYVGVELSLAIGSIPACAGEPHLSRHCDNLHKVYPRVCGGTVLDQTEPTPQEGLSPRVRGNQWTEAAERMSLGSIPACAGEPIRPRIRDHPLWVYPRVCGGTDLAQGSQLQPTGLSPRVRGNHPSRSTRARTARSIPACAGEPL